MKYDIRSTALAITGEAHTITDGVIKLNETASDIVITGFTEVTGTPNASEFKPLYFTDAYGRTVAGILQFNVADEETDVTVAYNGYGSIIWADDWNENVNNYTHTLFANDLSDIIRGHLKTVTGYGSVDIPSNASGQVNATVYGNSKTNIALDTWATSLDGWTSNVDSIVSNKYRITNTTIAVSFRDITSLLDLTKNYLVTVYGISATDTDGTNIEVWKNSAATRIATSATLTKTQSARLGCIVKASDMTGATDIRFYLNHKGSGYTEYYQFFIQEISSAEILESAAVLMARYHYRLSGTKSTASVRLTAKDSANNIVSQLYLPAIGQSVGTVKDEISVSGGTATKTQNISDVDTLDGTESWAIYDVLTNTYGFYLAGYTNAKKGADGNGTLIIGGSSFSYANDDDDDEHFYFFTTLNSIRVFITKAKVDAMAGANILEKFKAYLSANNGTLIYWLITPIVTEIETHGELVLYPGGWTYSEPCIWGYSTTATKTITTASLPIKTVTKVTRLDIVNGKLTETDVTADVSATATDITIANFVDGKTYFYDCSYDTSLSTKEEDSLACEVNNGIISHSYASATTAWTLTDNESKAILLTCTLAGGSANIVTPAIDGKMYVIKNDSGQTLTIKTASSTGVTSANGKRTTVIYAGDVNDFIKIGEV